MTRRSVSVLVIGEAEKHKRWIVHGAHSLVRETSVRIECDKFTDRAKDRMLWGGREQKSSA